MNNEIIIFGIGPFAKLMNYYFENDSDYKVIAFTVNKEYIIESTFEGKPVIPFENIENIYSPENYKMFCAIGYKNMRNRKKIYDEIKRKSYSMSNFISSKSIVSKDLIKGENNVIMQNVVIEPFVKMGNNNLFWTNSLICHDCKIKNHNFFASNSTIGGFCEINNNCFIGFSSTVIDNIKIADETLIGANSLILKNTEISAKYIGSPAKNVGNHSENGIIIDKESK